jgi:methylenetetrahydrofolate reductase (NADPH)
VPILTGLKPVTSKRQLNMIPSVFNAEIPLDLSREIQNAKTDAASDQVGAEWLLHQCKDLLKNNVPVLHFYTLGKPQIIYNVLKELF